MSIKAPVKPLDLAQLQIQQARAGKEGWFHRSLVAIDICFNVVVLRGLPDETISSHSARAALEGKLWGRVMSWFLDLFQSDHGAKAIAGDLERAENIESVEKKIE